MTQSRTWSTVGYGSVSYTNTSARLSSLVVEPPFDLTLTSKRFPKERNTARIPAGSNPKIEGWLYTDMVDIPDGTIILCQYQVRMHGTAYCDGALFIRARDDGSLINVAANIPANNSSLAPSTASSFIGRGDILQISDLIEADIVPRARFIGAFCNQEEVEECFDITVVEQGAPPPTYIRAVNRKGDEVVLVEEPMIRRMRIRKPVT